MMGQKSWLGVVLIAALYVLGGTLISFAQEEFPELHQPFAGARMVTGTADPTSAPLTVFDTSFKVPTVLGSGIEMDAEGNFAVSVDPPLVEGQTIIAVDAQGRASSPIRVRRAGSPAAQP